MRGWRRRSTPVPRWPPGGCQAPASLWRLKDRIGRVVRTDACVTVVPVRSLSRRPGILKGKVFGAREMGPLLRWTLGHLDGAIFDLGSIVKLRPSGVKILDQLSALEGASKEC